VTPSFVYKMNEGDGNEEISGHLMKNMMTLDDIRKQSCLVSSKEKTEGKDPGENESSAPKTNNV